MSKLGTVTLLILVGALQQVTHVCCQVPSAPFFVDVFCNNEDFGSYTANSPYEANLKSILSEMEKHSSTEFFHNTSSGSGASRVHGQYYCRGDVDLAFCENCIQQASQRAIKCSNAKAAVVWYRECTLRYSKESMFGLMESDPTLASHSKRNLTSPDDFSVALNETVIRLIEEAAEGKGFATGSKTVPASFTTTYFLVQCSPDLSGRQCKKCLMAVFNETRTCCGEWPIILYVFSPSCQVMYNAAAAFYFTPDAPSSPPPPPSSRSSPPNQITPTGGAIETRSRENMNLGITSIVLVLLALVLHTS